jgi:hypothetical protein
MLLYICVGRLDNCSVSSVVGHFGYVVVLWRVLRDVCQYTLHLAFSASAAMRA